MKSCKLFGYCILIVVGLQSCFKEVTLFDTEPTADLQLPVLMKFDGKDCVFDSELNMLRYPIPNDSMVDFSPLVEFQDGTEIFFDAEKLNNNQTNHLGNVRIGTPYKLMIKSYGTQKELDFIFTNLPIVQVISDSEIYDEPKCLARIKIGDPEATTGFSSYVGIEVRGKYSRGFDKKSMGFSLWKNMVSSDFSASLLGLKKNSEWILNSAVVDPSRIRNLVSIEIWNSLSNSETSGNYHLGVKSELVEVFINNSFNGIYTFSEKINTEFLDANNDAVLYKAIDWADGGTTFNNFSGIRSSNKYWNGWEQEIPDAKELVKWEPLRDLYKLVVAGSDKAFHDSIGQLIDMDGFIDYFILLNLTSASDNVGKNMFLFKKNNDAPFLVIPWDLDGSWGIAYDGQRAGYESILGNNLYDRLYKTNPDNYRERVKSRWLYLRYHNFRKENLFQHFDDYFQKLNSSDIIQKENIVWGFNLNTAHEQGYIEDWISKRLTFLDGYFQGW